jgi:hypothetical protein
MSDEDPPDDFGSEPPPAAGAGAREHGGVRESAKDRVRARLESVIPEILKRAVEIGVEKARESPSDVKQFIQDLKVPKELAHYLFQQIDDTKNGLFRVVAKEIRDFLEHTNFAGEVQKLLTTVQFEVNTTIRFTPNDGREPPRKNEKDKTDGQDASESAASANASHGGEPADGEGASADRDREPASRRDPSRASLPRPEVKTSVNVRRDDSAEPRRSRGSRGSS